METTPFSPADTALYSFDEEAHSELLHTLQTHHRRLRFDHSPGRVVSPASFTDVWVSDLALTKIMAHAESGGKMEVMGLLLGKTVVVPCPIAISSQGTAECATNPESIFASDREDALEGSGNGTRGYFVVTDCFALPVEGTETRVNAAEEANEFMIEFLDSLEKIPTAQKVVGWYHSHPNYGCWLSGIDVRTQQLQQQHQDPFLAIVVDPIRTLSNGRIEIGAFRTFLPGEETRGDDGDSASQLLPADKAHDFGVHWQQYYQLRTHLCFNSISTQLLEGMGITSWPDTLTGCSLSRNRQLELRRLEAAVQTCTGAISAAYSGHPAMLGDSGGHGVTGDYDSFDPVLPPGYSDELGIVQLKPLRQRFAETANQAGDVAVRALSALVETATLSTIYHGTTTWNQLLQ